MKSHNKYKKKTIIITKGFKFILHYIFSALTVVFIKMSLLKQKKKDIWDCDGDKDFPVECDFECSLLRSLNIWKHFDKITELAFRWLEIALRGLF